MDYEKDREVYFGKEPTDEEIDAMNKPKKATVILFKPTGKYYTEEEWRIPEKAIGPYDMLFSDDFRTIGGGPVLVVTQEPWGFPHLLLPDSYPRPPIPPQRNDNGE